MTLMMTSTILMAGVGLWTAYYYFFVGDKFGRLTVTNDTISGKLSSNNRTKDYLSSVLVEILHIAHGTTRQVVM